MLKIMNHMMMYSKRSKGETGITIPLKERKPFFQIKYYCKDYHKEGLFEFRYIPLDEVIDEIKSNLEICKNKNTINDTIEAIKVYLEEKNKKIR